MSSLLPLKSMTGFGSSCKEDGSIRFQIQLKCVNNKSLRLNIKSRPAIGILEKDIRDMVTSKLHRGSIDVFVEFSRLELDPDAVINKNIAKAAASALKKISVDYNLEGGVSVSDLIRFPGIFDLENNSEFNAAEKSVMLEALKDALLQVENMRITEGQATAKILLEHIKSVENFMNAARERSPLVVEKVREKLNNRIAEFNDSTQISDIDKNILEREVMFFADRADISEEVDRLASHIAQFRDTVKNGGETGKKLDFLSQELLRETNTIASKGNDTEIATIAIESKLAIEKIKEQVANIE